MDIIAKVFGLTIIFFGFAAWHTDYIIFSAIGALGTAFAATIGFTGSAVLGLQTLGWFIVLGLLSLLFILGSILFCIGLEILGE
jgi:hypothetical protein